MNLEKSNFEVSDIIPLVNKAIERELQKRSIYTKVSVENNLITSDDFTTTPCLFERLYICGGCTIEKMNDYQFKVSANVKVRYRNFDGGENGFNLFKFKCMIYGSTEEFRLIE